MVTYLYLELYYMEPDDQGNQQQSDIPTNAGQIVQYFESELMELVLLLLAIVKEFPINVKLDLPIHINIGNIFENLEDIFKNIEIPSIQIPQVEVPVMPNMILQVIKMNVDLNMVCIVLSLIFLENSKV